jgi:hypothetical protein
MESTPVKPRFCSFILLWIFATLSGFIFSLLFVEVGEKPDIGILQAIIGSGAIALPQSCILKKYKISSCRWVISTLLTWAVITAVGVGALGWVVPTTGVISLRLVWGSISGGIGGLAAGLAQWWLAISPSLPSAWQWIFVSSFSWALAVPTGTVIGVFLRRHTQLFLGEVVGLAITWLVVAILTGVSVYKLLK